MILLIFGIKVPATNSQHHRAGLSLNRTYLCLSDKVHRMAGPDIAEQVDDMICVMDKVVGSQLDTIIILLVGWLLFGAVIFLVSHLIYSTINTEPSSSASTIPLLSVSPPSDLPEVRGSDENHVSYVKVNILYFIWLFRP